MTQMQATQIIKDKKISVNPRYEVFALSAFHKTVST